MKPSYWLGRPVSPSRHPQESVRVTATGREGRDQLPHLLPPAMGPGWAEAWSLRNLELSFKSHSRQPPPEGLSGFDFQTSQNLSLLRSSGPGQPCRELPGARVTSPRTPSWSLCVRDPHPAPTCRLAAWPLLLLPLIQCPGATRGSGLGLAWRPRPAGDRPVAGDAPEGPAWLMGCSGSAAAVA